eukprot:NODE_41_length_2514_cov_2.129321.p1 GENE.NODE_41_length_2514_cov_2.129321~~NODE_41_length_2514_cov_2.129321.p1  ORF type:complete len:422 (+),score=111.13 NODE_41_length_2514_cov_2.129321:208-1473(+)
MRKRAAAPVKSEPSKQPPALEPMPATTAMTTTAPETATAKTVPKKRARAAPSLAKPATAPNPPDPPAVLPPPSGRPESGDTESCHGATAKTVAPAAAQAVTAAGGDVSAAVASGPERRALWMRYLRSRKHKGTSPGRNGVEGVPENLRSAVEGNVAHYFKRWVECGCSWDEVVMRVELKQERVEEAESSYSWVYGFQLLKNYPEEIANAWIKGMFGNPELCRPDPVLTNNVNAAMYYIKVEDSAVSKTKRSKLQVVALQADGPSMGQQGMASITQQVMSDFTSSSSTAPPLPAITDPSVAAAEEEERARVKAEKIATAAQPANVAQRLLSRLPNDIAKLTKAQISIANDETLPEVLREALKEEFAYFEKRLTELRHSLDEAGLAANDPNETTIAEVKADLTSKKRAFQAMVAIMKIYASKA